MKSGIGVRPLVITNTGMGKRRDRGEALGANLGGQGLEIGELALAEDLHPAGLDVGVVAPRTPGPASAPAGCLILLSSRAAPQSTRRTEVRQLTAEELADRHVRVRACLRSRRRFLEQGGDRFARAGLEQSAHAGRSTAEPARDLSEQAQVLRRRVEGATRSRTTGARALHRLPRSLPRRRDPDGEHRALDAGLTLACGMATPVRRRSTELLARDQSLRERRRRRAPLRSRQPARQIVESLGRMRRLAGP
jgi:hypothetical protein